ncbi:MAG: endonuclease/exonuclease/phosphatase family protein [Gemmatimonadaceae bacterium]|nr:endonuclease/exonuclease/phosphatase family protein [Chitinophagaceae bacterium]
MRLLLLILTICLCACTTRRVQTNRTPLTLKILSYNIHHANPPSRPNHIDVNAIAKVISDQRPDLVALQEVDVYTMRSGSGLNEASEIAKLAGMPYFFFAKAINHDGGEYGVAILSRYPLSKMKSRSLPDSIGSKAEKRTLGSALVALPGGRKILFASTHLDAGRGDARRVMQMQAVSDMLAQEKIPVIIAGDLNAQDNSEVIKILDRNFTRTCISNCGFTIPEIKPNKTIDYIAFRPAAQFSVLKHEVINESYASDHLPVFAEVQLK